MTPDDKPEFVRILNGLAAIKRVDLTKEAYEMWWAAMRDWSVDDFRDAAGYLLKNSEFMPSPYDFQQLRKLDQPNPHEAWAMALRHAEGGWRQGALGEAGIDRAVETIGGYYQIAMCDQDKLAFVQRRFMDAYESLSESDIARQALPNFAPTHRIGGSVSMAEMAKLVDAG